MAHVRLFRHYIHLPFVILGLIDLIVMGLAFALAVFFRFFGELDFFLDNLVFVLPSITIFALFNLIVMIALGVHQSRVEEGMSGMMLRTIMAMILAIPLHGFAYFVADDWLWYLGWRYFRWALPEWCSLLWSARTASSAGFWCWVPAAGQNRCSRT